MAGAAAPFTGSGINPQTLYQDITDSTPPGEELLARASPFRYLASQTKVLNHLASGYAVTTTDVGFIEDTSANKSLETSSEAEEAAEDDLAKALNALIAHGMLLGINTSLSTSSNWILKEISPNTVGIAPDGNHYGHNNPIFDYFGDQKTFRVVSEYTTSSANLSITLPTMIGVTGSIQVENPDGSTTMTLTQNKAYSFRTYFDGITPKIVIENADLVDNYIGDFKNSAQLANHGRWLLCNGQTVSRTTYSLLFNLIGTSFGVGNGSTTFTLPDCQGRVSGSIGSGSGLTTRTAGQLIGAETHTLTIAQMPAHTHSSNVNIGGTTGGGATVQSNGVTSVPTTSSTGGGLSHNNMQPTIFLGNTFIYAGV